MTHEYSNGYVMTSQSGLPLLRCQGLPFRHGFSTRLGGVSHGDGLDTLDLGAIDTPETEENRQRFVTAFDLPREALFFARQVHGTRIETVTASDCGKSFVCDGFVTKEPGLLLAVKTADCLPILLGDPEAGVVAAVHAGWRGTVAGIATHAVDAMVSLGADPKRIRAAFGPAIHRCCYEVDDPFVEAVGAAKVGELLLTAIVPDPYKPGHYHADLPLMNEILLHSAGLSSDHIFGTAFCTACAPTLFFSHRASSGKRGLMMAGIRADCPLDKNRRI